MGQSLGVCGQLCLSAITGLVCCLCDLHRTFRSGLSQSSMQCVALKDKVMLMVQLMFVMWVASTFPKPGVTFELEDTIHALREENSYLQERLESLTEALRELRKLLWNHSKESGVDLDSNEQHFWDNWSEFGKRTDAYQVLERAFCGKELRGVASYSPQAHAVVLLFSLCLGHLL